MSIFNQCEADILVSEMAETQAGRDSYLGLAEQEFGKFY
jgi:hypothetical protein